MKEKFKQWVKDNAVSLNQLSMSLAESGIETDTMHITLDGKGYMNIELDYGKDIRAVRIKSGEPFMLRTSEMI